MVQRIMVVGCCGAGKSTLARKLQQKTGLDVYHLDQYYWKADWKETPMEDWEPVVQELCMKDAWIIDGNYGSTMDRRLKRADTVIYLDFPIYKCLWRITKRILKYRGTERPDMTTGCKERFDLEFYHYVATFNLLRRKPILDKLKTLDNSKKVFIFKSDKQTEAYLKTL